MATKKEILEDIYNTCGVPEPGENGQRPVFLKIKGKLIPFDLEEVPHGDLMLIKSIANPKNAGRVFEPREDKEKDPFIVDSQTQLLLGIGSEGVRPRIAPTREVGTSLNSKGGKEAHTTRSCGPERWGY